MRRRLVHDHAARSDLVGIWLYTRERWGEAQAEIYLGLIEAAINALVADPQRGRSRESIRAGYWSRSVERHVIFYTFTDTELRIRRVLHDAMDLPSRLSIDQ